MVIYSGDLSLNAVHQTNLQEKYPEALRNPKKTGVRPIQSHHPMCA